jgi:thioredoxin reductase
LTLYQSGVYVSFEELKGLTPAVRGSQRFTFRSTDFDNPRITPHFYGSSGGTRGRPSRIMIDRAFAHPKIEVIWNSAVEEILAEGDPPGVTGVRLRHLPSGEQRVVAAEGVFVAIGHAPATELFRGQLEMDASGYIKTPPGAVTTSVPGVFAAGDVADATYRQAVTAAGLGCMAALDAERWLAHALPAATAATAGEAA